MVTRAELRQVFVDAVNDAGKNLSVFNGRHIDAIHDVLPAAIVGFDDIDVEQDLFDSFRFTGELVITIAVSGDDDLLDTYIDPVIVSVLARMRSQLPTVGCQLSNLSYNRELDPGLSAAVLIWQVDFNG